MAIGSGSGIFMELLVKHTDVLYTSSAEIQICCPFCGDSKHHMYVNMELGVAHCFKCEWGGRVYRLLTEGFNIPQLDVRRAVEHRGAALSLRDYDVAIGKLRATSGVLATTKPTAVSLPVGYVPFSGSEPHDMIGKMALRYLVNLRGFNSDVIARYGIGYGTVYPTAGRVIIPIGENFWQARSIFSKTSRKYINPPIPKAGALFNAAALTTAVLFIAEGVFSAIRLGTNAVALLGKKATAEQLARLQESKAKVVQIHLDADAKEYAYDLAATLVRGSSEREVLVQEYESGDPDRGVRGKLEKVSGTTMMRRRIIGSVRLV